MSEKELLELLRESLVSEKSAPLTDAEADARLSAPVKQSPVNIKRLRKGVVERILSDLHQEPVREIGRRITFGQWIQQARKAARLSHDAAGIAIGKDPSFIQRIEDEEVLPWALTANSIADMVILFRIHIDAVEQLLSNSYAADRERQLSRMFPQMEGQYSGVRGALILPGHSESSDEETKSSDSDTLPMDEDLLLFLNKLRRILERRQATHLL
jgi:ribosome-binding protein aMBF1 (putative translation factor)